jgi:tRNA(fMet)-specific endonuclease VapC
MPVLLDTDHFSVLQRNEQPAASVLQSRLSALPGDDVLVCIVSFQEQAKGWLAFINRARKPDEIIRGFDYLHDLLRHYLKRQVLPFDQAAMNEFALFKQQRIRVGTSDLRIAAIAKANRVKLLTRNLRDFRLISGLDADDWTI